MLSKWQYLFSFIICVLLCLVNSYEKVQGYTCAKAQIDSNYTFYGKFEHTIDAPVKIAWVKDGKDVSHCIPGLACSETNEEETTTTLNHLGNGNYAFQLFVNRITTKDAGQWSLEYFGPAIKYYPPTIFSCQLKLAGENVSEVETTPPERVTEIYADPNNEINKSGEMVHIIISLIVGGTLFFTLLLICLCNKHSLDPYQRVAIAKETIKKLDSNDETNIVSKGWSKFNHLIAKIFSITKKASSVSDNDKRYIIIQCTQESHVTFPASEL